MPSVIGIIPAAGVGSRFGAALPKQFQEIAGRPLVDHAISALLADARIDMVHVLCAPERSPAHMPGASLPADTRQRVTVHGCGGATRADTVSAAADLFADDPATWLVVHDSVRPCLHREDLAAVLDASAGWTQPALLAEPLTATLKQAQGDKSVATLPRADKWLAQTPQVVSAGMLREALRACPEATDEAQALERAGHAPVLVAARHPNPKVTVAADMVVAEMLLRDGQGSG